MDCDGVGAKDIFPFTPLPEVPGKNPSARRALYNVADELGRFVSFLTIFVDRQLGGLKERLSLSE